MPSSLILLGTACAGALLALIAVVVGQRARNARVIASMRRSLAASADWWWRTDAELRMTEIEPGRQLPADIDLQGLHGKAPWQIAKDDKAVAPAELQLAITQHAPFYDVLIEVPSPTAARSFALSGVPVFSASGRFAGYAGVARDITATIRAARAADEATQLKAQMAQLQADNAARTQQLEITVKELDNFAHSVSHDLRAPLRVVDGFAQIVLEDYGQTGKALDDLGREHLKRIVTAGNRMNSMIDTLLDLSKMTSREIERDRVDLSQIARELAEDLRAQDPQRSVEFVIANGLAVDGDRTLLRLVLQNLMGNAYKFSAKNPAARVEFGCQPEAMQGRSRIYLVRDNGAGFDMRFAEKLFGLFQRFHSANQFPGTGVGLATVQRIVRKHGGRIWAESRPGEGATFFFTIHE